MHEARDAGVMTCHLPHTELFVLHFRLVDSVATNASVSVNKIAVKEVTLRRVPGGINKENIRTLRP